MQRSRYLTLAASLMLVAACGDKKDPTPEKPAENTPQDKTCGNSGRVCVGDTVCCGNSCVNVNISPNNCGKCGEICDSTAGESCIEGECKVKQAINVCEQSDSQCTGNEFKICNDNNWSTVSTCTADQDCDDKLGCIERKPDCTEGNYSCHDDGDLYVCSNGKEKLASACGSAICNAAEGTCDFPVCDADAKKCENNKVMGCNADRSGWEVIQGCSSSEMCEDNNCVAIKCTSGDKACRDGDVYECTNNDYQLLSDCSNSQFCDETKKECIDIVCTAGEKRCANNGVEICKNNGWSKVQDCSATQYCDSSSNSCKQKCGNGELDEGELCDGAKLNNSTCASATGFADAIGTISCNGSCDGFVTTGCTYCGDNKKNGDELCDGVDGTAPTCADALNNKYAAGSVVCQKNCKGWDTQYCSQPECTDDNPVKCDGNTLKLCINGYWTTEEICDGNDNVCSEAAWGCVAMAGTCNDTDDIVCDGNKLVMCEKGFWKTYQVCEDTTPYCDKDKGCLATAPKCDKIGQLKCEGSTVMKCGNDYQWSKEQACGGSGNNVCIEENGTAGCYYSTETCNDYETKCADRNVLTCWNGHWMYTMTCYDAKCNPLSGLCEGYDGCTPEAVRCNDNSIEMCSEKQVWISDIQDCSDTNQVCHEANGEASCINASTSDCNENDTKCSGASFIRCINGKWNVEKTCTDGINILCDQVKGCFGGCEKDAVKCTDDNHYLVCDEHGYWVDMVNCTENTNGLTICDTSAAGGCVAEKECDKLWFCDNNSLFECVNGINKPTGTVCAAGVNECVADNVSDPCATPTNNATWGTFQYMDNLSVTNGHAYMRFNPNGHKASEFEARLACGPAKQGVIDWSLTSTMTQNKSCDNCGNNFEFMAPIPAGVSAGMYCTVEIRDAGTFNWFYFPPNGENKSQPPLLVEPWLYRDNKVNNFWGVLE